MGLEAFTFIKNLTKTWPLGTDPKSEGDDHIRGIKTVLQNQFSGFTDGIPITLTETQINSRNALSVGGKVPGTNPGDLAVLDANGKVPAAVNSDTVGGHAPGALPGNVPILDANGLLPAANTRNIVNACMRKTNQDYTATYYHYLIPFLTAVYNASTVVNDANKIVIPAGFTFCRIMFDGPGGTIYKNGVMYTANGAIMPCVAGDIFEIFIDGAPQNIAAGATFGVELYQH